MNRRREMKLKRLGSIERDVFTENASS